MLNTRIIPCLQLVGRSLVKAVKFGTYGYIGDPINTVRIFNELEVDELCFLDIRATLDRRPPSFDVLHQIADECFMPLSYGGGISDFETAKKIFAIGFEKVVLNTATFEQPDLIRKLSEHFGTQAIIGSVDVRKTFFGKYQVFVASGTKKIPDDPVEWSMRLEKMGVGEILLNSIDREGSWSGFDVELTRNISNAVTVPVIAHGGAGSTGHIEEVVKRGHASAVALGSMVVYQKKDMGVLINFPDKTEIERVLSPAGPDPIERLDRGTVG